MRITKPGTPNPPKTTKPRVAPNPRKGAPLPTPTPLPVKPRVAPNPRKGTPPVQLPIRKDVSLPVSKVRGPVKPTPTPLPVKPRVAPNQPVGPRTPKGLPVKGNTPTVRPKIDAADPRVLAPRGSVPAPVPREMPTSPVRNGKSGMPQDMAAKKAQEMAQMDQMARSGVIKHNSNAQSINAQEMARMNKQGAFNKGGSVSKLKTGIKSC